LYVAIEGIDCVGKTTQIELLKSRFKNAVFTKEPGGTELGSILRDIVLQENNYSKKSLLFLFLADRAEHIDKVIKKSVENKKMVISDRSLISGIAYADDNFNFDFIADINKFIVEEFLPTKVVILTISSDEYTKRVLQRGKKEDNIEKNGVDYMMGVQERLEHVCKKFNLNYIKIDAMQKKESIFKKIEEFIND